MSERTTIGGTVYEAIGSSSSNLLLRCNGTARIQWGGKLIDLIKNGKIASSDSKELIFTVSSESEIKSDGVYILTTGESNYLWICKDGVKYDLTNTDLYISASKPQNLTSEQKKQALNNIGMYYNTLKEVEDAKIQYGLVYVLENKTLYTISNGVITEFEAKLKTVEVDNVNTGEDVIKGKVKLVLSILDDEYLVLADKRITACYSIHIKDSAQIGSESADKTKGYRLYIDGDTSYLDVDEINVRNGIKVDMYKKIDFSNFDTLITSDKLEPQAWYLITDFQNHWKLPIDNTGFNRPILVRALTNKTLYETGYLFRDHSIKLHYDPSYKEIIIQKKEVKGEIIEEEIITRGRITWMKDSNNNEANFDFLDYTDAENKELAILHYPDDNKEQDKSIFPKYSHDNKLTVYDLKGTVLKDKKIDNTNVTVVEFQFVDFNETETETEIPSMQMYNNDIECRGLVLTPTCNNFCNNILHEAANIEISTDFYNNEFLTIYNFEDVIFSEVTDNSIFNKTNFSFKTENVKCESAKRCTFQNELTNCTFKTVSDTNLNQKFKNVTINEINKGISFTGEISNSYINKIINSGENKSINSIKNSTIESIENSTINFPIINSTFNNILNCTFNATLDNVVFKDLDTVNFEQGTINNTKSFYDLTNINFNQTDYTLLYNTDKRKEIYIHYGVVQVICIPDVIFYRGMIIMHSGETPIPEGWAICDGGTYTFEGVTSTTPKLTDRFIKAVTSSEDVGETKNPELNDDNELMLKKKHIPKHQHEIDINKLPEYTSDEISGYTSRYDPQSMTVTTTTGTLSVGVSVCVNVSVGESSDSDCDSSSDSITLSGSTLRYLGQGGSYETIEHQHKMNWGSANILTEEQNKDIKQEAFKVEPHYYSLIFIMKL